MYVLKDACSLDAVTNLDSIIKNQRHYFAEKGFSSSYVQMWELDHKEGWVPKNWCFPVVPEKILESPLDGKEIKPVSSKGNQPLIFIERSDDEAEAPILWPSDVKIWLIGKDPVAGNDWRQKEKRVTEDEMVSQHHELNGHEFEQTPGDSEGQGSQFTVLQFMGLQRLRHDLATEQQQCMF